MIRLAHEHDMVVIVGCMAESQVGIAAAAALASLSGGADRGPAHDLDGGLLVSEDPVDGGVTYEGEWIRLSQSPGTGILGLAIE